MATRPRLFPLSLLLLAIVSASADDAVSVSDITDEQEEMDEMDEEDDEPEEKPESPRNIGFSKNTKMMPMLVNPRVVPALLAGAMSVVGGPAGEVIDLQADPSKEENDVAEVLSHCLPETLWEDFTKSGKAATDRMARKESADMRLGLRGLTEAVRDLAREARNRCGPAASKTSRQILDASKHLRAHVKFEGGSFQYTASKSLIIHGMELYTPLNHFMHAWMRDPETMDTSKEYRSWEAGRALGLLLRQFRRKTDEL